MDVSRETFDGLEDCLKNLLIPSKLAEAEALKKQVADDADKLAALEAKEAELAEKIHKIMLVIPQMPIIKSRP